MRFELHRVTNPVILASLVAAGSILSGCGAGQTAGRVVVPETVVTQAPAMTGTRSFAQSLTMTHRSHFLGAFFRAQAAPPFGVLEANSPGIEPQPYPTPGSTMTGPNGYCDEQAANGASIDGSYIVDPTKLADVVNLGVGWTRTNAFQFTDDVSHIFGPGVYNFTDLDATQCVSLVYHGMQPVINLEAGPIQYNAVPGEFSPTEYPLYKTAQDFGGWCGVVAAHEKAVFGVSKFSLPGNEVNTNEQLYPGGEPQLAAYSEACYSAIKSANPQAFVYAFELNMDGNVNAPGFVARMYALGCKVGTCYDGIAMHLALRYPVPAGNPPCYPQAGGDYTVLCINAVQAAAQAKVHVLISETQYTVPGSVPDEQTKALAVASDFSMISPHSSVDGMSYANVDECAVYPTGYWSGGCLIDISGNQLPAYTTLQGIALANFQ